MTFTAQELANRIDLQRSTMTQDEAGSVHYTWATFASVYAKVEPLVGREFFAAFGVQAEQTVKFTIRHRPDLRVVDRLTYNGQAYDIYAVQHIKGRNRETLVMAKTLNP